MQLLLNTHVEGPTQGVTPRDVLKALHDHSEELGLELVVSLRDRTPKDTGALRESATAKGSKGNVGEGRLLSLYYDDEPQLFEWNRVYAPYQEGPPLGLSTYTNPPRQMLYQTQDVDGPAIQAWAQRVLDSLNSQAEADRFAGTLEEALAAIFPGWLEA